MKMVIATGSATAVALLTIGLTAPMAQRGATSPPAQGAPAPPARGTPAPPARGTPAAPARGTPAASTYNGPRTPDRKPDLNGIWQVLGTAHWNLEPHSAIEGVPAGMGVVEGEIPYLPAALAKRNENFQNRMTADPLRKCYMPGVPRATYLPFPFEITQTPQHIGFAYEFAHATRTIFTDGTPHLDDLEFWMGDGRGLWEGDTLVVNTVSLGSETWLDQAGNFHSDALHVVERFTPMDFSHINYEVTLTDPKVYSRAWKMSMIIYRRLEKNLELLEYECTEHLYLKLFKERAGKK
jgi:hypothetical protein